MPSLLRTEEEITEIYNRYADTVYRVCYSFMKNKPETEDMVQETFLRLLSCGVVFQNRRHEKAWLIVTASNLCKDSLRKWWRRNDSLEEQLEAGSLPMVERSAVLDAILELPPSYKVPIYMHYYEGYSTAEIGKYLGLSDGTIRSRLSRARKMLKKWLGGESDDASKN